MADASPNSHRRESIKASVGNIASNRRRQHAVSIGKEKRDALVRAKRLCRAGISTESDAPNDSDMMIDEQQSILDAQTSSAVETLKTAVSFQGKGAMQKKVSALRELRRLLSKSEFPPVDIALKAGAVPLLVECLSFGSSDEQLLESAWCLTNIAAGQPEETRSLLPALPLLIAHLGDSWLPLEQILNTHLSVDENWRFAWITADLAALLANVITVFGEKSSLLVAEQCAWALGNVAGEGEELRNVLLSQGALLPLARMLTPNKGSTVRTAAWALSNLIKGPDPKASTELIKIDGVLDAIIRHLRKADEELATEVAWVVVYLSALSNYATGILVKSDVLELLVQRLATSNSLQLLIPVLRSLGNLVAGDSHTTSHLAPGHESTENAVAALGKCLKSEHRVLKKEAAWVLSNIAAGSVEHKRLIFVNDVLPVLLRLLSTAPFDIRKEVAYVLGNLCVAPVHTAVKPHLVVEHLVSLVEGGCLPGFIDLVRSADIEGARLGLQFLELVLRGMPNGKGPKLVEMEDGIDAMERFQFHENEDLRNIANGLVDKYFGEDYGIDD